MPIGWTLEARASIMTRPFAYSNGSKSVIGTIPKLLHRASSSIPTELTLSDARTISRMFHTPTPDVSNTIMWSVFSGVPLFFSNSSSHSSIRSSSAPDSAPAYTIPFRPGPEAAPRSANARSLFVRTNTSAPPSAAELTVCRRFARSEDRSSAPVGIARMIASAL